MMKDARLQAMEKEILEAGALSMDELCRRFSISMHTLRRDVAELETRGQIEKVYGGVVASGNGERRLKPFPERSALYAEQKRECCRAAAGQIQDHDVIFVDSGTTLSSLADFLADREGLTIVTNNLNLMLNAIPYENLQMILLPGRLRRKTFSLTGAETVAALRQYNIRKAFMATSGTTERTVTNSSPNEYEVKKAAVEIIPERYLLLTKEKFGHPGLLNYAEFRDFQAIVTDREPEEPWLTSIRESGARLICASEIP